VPHSARFRGSLKDAVTATIIPCIWLTILMDRLGDFTVRMTSRAGAGEGAIVVIVVTGGIAITARGAGIARTG
jgi:hypothetical protein